MEVSKAIGSARAEDVLALLTAVATEAGRIALGYFRRDHKVWTKHGDSPVTEADLEVDHYLKRELLAAMPDAGWISEETEDSPDRHDRDIVFVVDPIDGTRGFIKGDPNWCISIALVDGEGPAAAVLNCPAIPRIFTATRGHGARLDDRPIATDGPAEVKTLAGSHGINRAIRKAFPEEYVVSPFLPSLAYRLALVATGEIDGAFARTGSHEWDIAAADLILRESGCRLVTASGEPPSYNTRTRRMPSLIAAHSSVLNDVSDIAERGGFLQ